MSYDLMFQKAIELQNNGALNEAEDIYLKMLEAMPENSDVWNLLGLIAQSKGNAGRAADCFLAAIRYAPAPFAPHFFNLGLAYRSLNKKREALDALQRAVDLQPDLKEAWNFLGLCEEETGDHAGAVKSFCRALDIDGGYLEARANLCFYTKDKETLFKLADEREDDFQANLLAADMAGSPAQKEHYLRRAVAASPFHTGGLLALAAQRMAAGDMAEALQLYHKVLNLDANSVEAILGLADIYLARGETDKAENYYTKSFDIRRDIAGAHLNYGILLYRQKRFSEALEEYRAAAVLAPETPEISYNLAQILKETGDYEEALGLMFNAHQRAPERREFSANIMETLTMLAGENAELALKIAENWQKLEPDNIFSKRILAGISGMNATPDDDKAYAEQLFDLFAETYDETMARLEPKIISEFKRLHGDIHGRALDLGCGTGLAADALKNDGNVFYGVDISDAMLAAARQKGRYEKLIKSDIAAYLKKNPPAGKFDIVLAFDVFCYFGALEESAGLLKGAETWFSTEAADDSETQDFFLAAGGRYKHKKSYVLKTLAAAGFARIEAFPLTLRRENGQDVPGFLFKALP